MLWTPVLSDRKDADIFIKYIFVGVVVFFGNFHDLLSDLVKSSSEWSEVKAL